MERPSSGDFRFRSAAGALDVVTGTGVELLSGGVLDPSSIVFDYTAYIVGNSG